MGLRIKKSYLAGAVLFILAAGFLIYMTPGSVRDAQSDYSKPDNFTEGLWIVKYPGNNACFRFETPEGRIIVSDPFQMDEYVVPEIVTVSHFHPDHYDTVKLGGKYKVLKKAGVYHDGEVSITGIKGLHDNPRVPVPGNTDNIMFVFDFNGIRVADFASQGVFPTDDMFERMGNADIVILQLGSGGTKMDLNECSGIVKRLGAKIVIPAHGDQSLDPVFADLLRSNMKYVDNGEIIITRKELDASKEPEILVLDSY